MNRQNPPPPSNPSPLKRRLQPQKTISSYISKQGEWSLSQKQKILSLITVAYKTYASELQPQINFLHSNIQNLLGKRIQIFIYDRKGTEGHTLYSYNSKHIEVQVEEFTYVIWKVKLIEDIPLEKEY